MSEHHCSVEDLLFRVAGGESLRDCQGRRASTRHRRSRFSLLSSRCLLLVPRDRAAQRTKEEVTPVAVVTASFRAQRDRAWSAFLSLSHPRAIAAFREHMLKSMSALEAWGGRRDGQRGLGQLLSQFFGVRPGDELRTLSSDTLLVRFLAYTRDAYTDAGAHQPPRILGDARDGDSTGYAV